LKKSGLPGRLWLSVTAIRRPAEPAIAFGPLDFGEGAFNYPLHFAPVADRTDPV
jgi:hypothetical protein